MTISSKAENTSPITETKTLTKITVFPESQSLEVGGAGSEHGDMGEKITVTAFYSDNTSQVLDKKEDVEWTVADPQIADIDWWEDGIIYGNSYVPAARTKVGTTIATAKVGDFTATCSITSTPKDFNNNVNNRPDYNSGKIDPIPDQSYTGSTIAPKVKFVFGMWDWKENEDYTVSYSNNIEVGTATVTVTGINRLKGSVSTTFLINKSEKQVEYPLKNVDNPIISDVSKGITFTMDVSFDKFIGVTLNGRKLIRDVEYTAKAGSTIITLLPNYLKTLGNGKHELLVEFTDGVAKASFEKSGTPVSQNTGMENKKSPKTGDETSAAPIVMLIGACLVIGKIKKVI